MPVFRNKLTRQEPVYPTITSVFNLDERNHQRRHGLDIPASRVYSGTVRHHPYGHRTESPEMSDGDCEDRLVYGVGSSFLIPDWIFDEKINKDSVIFEADPLPLSEQHTPPVPKEPVFKTAVHKTLAFSRKLFSCKASRSR